MLILSRRTMVIVIGGCLIVIPLGILIAAECRAYNNNLSETIAPSQTPPRLGKSLSRPALIGSPTIVLTVKDQNWNESKSIAIELELQNETDAEFAADGIALFSLSPLESTGLEKLRETYWCPVDLFRNAPLAPNHKVRITLAPRASLKLKLEIGAFYWDRQNSSNWPRLNLFAVVPQRAYELCFLLVMDNAENVVVDKMELPATNVIRSNRIKINIDRAN